MNVIELEQTSRRRGRDTVRIVLTDDIEAGVDEAVRALADAGVDVYQSGGVLMHMASDVTEKGGEEQSSAAPRLAPVGQARMAEFLSSSAVWVREGKDKKGETRETPCLPPQWVVRGVLERGQWAQLRRASGVTEVPVLRADGSILSEPGYDPSTELIYRPNREYRVPVVASHADAMAARDVLLDAVCDFPFASDAHRAGWLACALTPFAMRAVDGPSPMFAFDANTRGSGKSLAADVATRIASGRAVPRSPHSDDHAEDRKRITTHAMAGDRVIFIDNVRGIFGSPAWEAAATSTRWKDRVLGQSAIWEGEFKPTVVLTGNNLEFTGDMCRRVCHVRIEAEQENPEERQGFKHPMLLEWAEGELPRLVEAAITILRAYALAGRPVQEVAPWGSYEAWNRLVASAVRWVGMPDLSATRQELIDAADEERRTLAEFLRVLNKHAPWGITAKGILQDCSSNEELREAVMGFCPGRRGEMPESLKLGKRMSAAKGRVIGGLRLMQAGEDRTNSIQWMAGTVRQA